MSKIMELAEYYATLREDGVRRELEDEALAALQAEVEKLETEAIAWKVCNERNSDAAHDLAAERDALRKKLAAVEKDAARYRWLTSDKADGRNSTGMARVAVYTVWGLFTRDELSDKGDIDAAIDAAMEATK